MYLSRVKINSGEALLPDTDRGSAVGPQKRAEGAPDPHLEAFGSLIWDTPGGLGDRQTPVPVDFVGIALLTV